jgi:anaphase-promoting complex subunit 6
MEHLRMFNFPLAGEYLDAGLQMCDSDPLLFNELGVLAYHVEKYVSIGCTGPIFSRLSGFGAFYRYDDAVEMFQKALTLANTSQTSEQAWRGTYLNLGQAYRKLGCASVIP